MIFDQNLSNSILTYVSEKTKDAEFIVFLIISIFSLVIKKVYNRPNSPIWKDFYKHSKGRIKKTR